MNYLYEPYTTLTAEQQKLLCFVAYVGKRFDRQLSAAYAKLHGLTTDQLRKTTNSILAFFRYNYYYYDEHEIHPHHVAPLLLYLLVEHQDWLAEFDKIFRSKQAPARMELLMKLRMCLDHDITSFNTMADEQLCQILVPLAAERTFLPLMFDIPSSRITDFVVRAVVYQMENDIDDPENMVGKIAETAYGSLMKNSRETLQSIVALYDFFKQGRFNEQAAVSDNIYARILLSTRALYRGDYDLAFTLMTQAIRLRNKDVDPSQKGFFNLVLNNLMLVMAYHFKTADEHKKLAALLKKDYFMELRTSRPVSWLARYLVDGWEPAEKSVKSAMNEHFSLTGSMTKWITLLAARFFHLPAEPTECMTALPRIRLLRHELSSWLPLSDEERQQLETAYGGKPLISRFRHKQRWELLLEELTPKEKTVESLDAKTVRVGYFISYNRVEVREQSRLKSGLWGAGKRMSLDTFRRGTDFMDEADRKVADSIRGYYSSDIDIACVLPHMVGSDRVYSGFYAPYQPVTIEEEKPYLVIERTKTAFTVKSNLGDVKTDNNVVFRKDSNTHYTVIKMTPLQRSYYLKLLAIGAFPLEAEQQLREFLPKVSDVVEVHSPLVEGGSTLEQRQGQPKLCVQVLPMQGTRNIFTVYCMVRPLLDGITLLDPGTGINPCVAEVDGTRYQVTRDMRGERENLLLLRTFLNDNDMAPDSDLDPFAGRSPVTLDAEGLLMLMQFVQEQKDHFVMEWPEGGQLQLKTSNPASWNIGLKSKNGWFEVEGEIPIDDDTVLTASQLLQLVAGSGQKKGFIRLSDTEFLAVTDRLRKQLARLESLTTNNRGHLQVSELHATLLGSTLSGEVEIKHDEKIDRLQEKIKKSMAATPQTPRVLKAELRDYQQDGYQWMCRMTDWGAGVCLADDMGLGKTVQTIAFMLHTQSAGPALVAAPASVVLNWRRELERFAPSLSVIVLNTASDREKAIKEARKGDVVLTTYGLFVTEAEHLLQKKWNTVCLDEAHVIKNRETKTSQAVMQLQAKNRIILTGTPVQNHLGELWNLYQFINPGLLGSYDQFSQKYIVPIEQQDNKERSKQLKRIIQPFILRRTKQEVVEELPDKTEIILPVELSDEEMAVYEVIRRRAKELLEVETAGSPSVNTLAEITRLRQAACAAQLAEKKWKGECSKINTLMSQLEEIVGGGNSVLVFSQFTSFLALVRKALDKAGTPYAYLDGSVGMKQRDQLVQDFQQGRQQIFLISLKAGGLGLNLTGANYVIHLDPWWNPAIEQQATDRAYRIGQRQNVTVYHLIAQHTIEEKILRLHETKRNLADAMLEGTSQSHKLTSKDLLEMIG